MLQNVRVLRLVLDHKSGSFFGCRHSSFKSKKYSFSTMGASFSSLGASFSTSRASFSSLGASFSTSGQGRSYLYAHTHVRT